jgi:hypothetical protein
MDVFGCLFAVLDLMNLPVIADRFTVLVLLFVAISEFSFKGPVTELGPYYVVAFIVGSLAN